MDAVKLWVLRILDGFLTLLGEIVMFFGVYSFLSSRNLTLGLAGLFLLFLGQMAGVSSMRYEDRKRLEFFAMDVLENVGRQFAYPVLVFVIYMLDKSGLFLALAFTLALIAFVKSLVILYKARVAESLIA